MRARAVCFVGPRRVEPCDVEVPEPATGEVLVQTLYSGISGGTEMLAYRGELDPGVPLDQELASLAGTFAFPFRYGYSCVGVVERSRSEHAEGAPVFAFHPHQDRFVARATDVVAMDAVDLRLATLFPLVETALQLSLDAGPVLHEDVVVLGLGAVGILGALLLQRAGAAVVATDPLAWRRAVAAGVGVDVLAPEDLADRMAARTGDRGVSLVVEASGNPEALAEALPLLAHEGTALVASWYGSKDARLPLGTDFHRRRLTIRSSQVSTIPARLSGRWTTARRRAVARGLLQELPLKPLATHEFAFDRAAEAFDAIDRRLEGLVHAALRYR